MRTRALALADIEAGGFVPDSELTSWINDSGEDLYGQMVENDQFRFEAESALNIVSGTAEYSLPADFYKLNAVDLRLGSNNDDWYSIRPFTNADRNRLGHRYSSSARDLNALRYQLRGSQIRITPTPSSGYTGRLLYVPTLAELSADGDTFPTGFPPGFTRWVIHDVAVKCLLKEESDASQLMADRDRIGMRLLSEMKERDLNEPIYVADVRGAVPTRFYDDEEWL